MKIEILILLVTLVACTASVISRNQHIEAMLHRRKTASAQYDKLIIESQARLHFKFINGV